MSGPAVAVCPNCGAPLELLPDRSCKWCRAHIVQEPRSTTTGLSPFEAQAVRAQAFTRQMQQWTLGPQGPPIDWSGPPASPTENLRPPLRDLISTMGAGLGHPGVRELAADEVLDRQFCRLVAGAMNGGGMAKLCGVVVAVAVTPGTDPAWARAARATAGAAKQELIVQRSWKEGRDYQAPIVIRDPAMVSPLDLRSPGLAALDQWVEAKFEGAGLDHRRWWRR